MPIIIFVGVQCYRDPIESSCLLFGSSGSSIVRPFRDGTRRERYSWQGPLSMYKGCDGAWILNGTRVNYGGQNPGVFTDGACYLPWIAEQYGLEVDPSLRPSGNACAPSSGDLLDVNQTRCITNRSTAKKLSYCAFSWNSVLELKVAKEKNSKRIVLDKCKLFGVEGYAESISVCRDNFGNLASCPNNCIGMDPNAVIIGGTAIAAATALGGIGTIPTLAGLTGMAALGFGTMAASGQCPPGSCQVIIHFVYIQQKGSNH